MLRLLELRSDKRLFVSQGVRRPEKASHPTLAYTAIHPRGRRRGIAGRALAVFVVLSAGVASCSGVEAASTRRSPVVATWTEPAAGYGFLTSAVAHATASVSLSVYELRDPSLAALLEQRARAGVRVRVLLDAAFYGRQDNQATFNELAASRVHVEWAPTGQIFHAKYAVIDGRVAYIGTGNLVSADYPSTRDFWVEDRSPRDVAAITTTFDDDFARETRAPVPSAGLVWSPGSASTLVTLISSARRSLLVENEEMSSGSIEEALGAAAQRGVDVEVVMTASSQWTSALRSLASEGVHVRTLGPSQLYIHAKVICVDCVGSAGMVFVGSENFSTSSLDDNRELGVVTTSSSTVGAVRLAVALDFSRGVSVGGGSTPVTSKGLVITSFVAKVTPGEYDHLSVHDSAAHQACSLEIVLPSGTISASHGLGTATTDSQGDARWNWRIGTSTRPGVATAEVSCGSRSLKRSFTITP